MTDYTEIDVYGVILRFYDEERIDRIMTRRWNTKWETIKQTKQKGYKIICIGNNKPIKVHRVVYKAHNLSWNIEDNSKNNYIDHKDRCRSNNKIENLQVATHQQNQFNQNAKGYYFHKQMNKYQAQITLNGKAIYLGLFDTADDAHQAYLEAKSIYHI
jgi:hypothetical protein